MVASLQPDHNAPSFDDPLGMLVACHRRIERQLATLSRLQRHLPENGCDADARAAARVILKYFDSAGPNHDADEELSLFPRLRVATSDAHALVDALKRDHVTVALHWRKLRPLLASIAAGRRATLPPKQTGDFAECYQTHIAREENDLLPLAEAVLDLAALQAIGQEMAARRGVDPTMPMRRSA
jgi:hemerythrin-like domain-containing protein